MSPTLIAFISVAVLAVVPAFFVVTQRNIVHAGFWLLPSFLGIAGIYAVLEAHFFVVIQVLVYVGAILVLILFALMLTRDVMSPTVPQTNRLGLWAGLASAASGLAIAAILASHPWGPSSTVQPKPAYDQAVDLGQSLIEVYALPFEVASLLLLAALIGAVVLAKSEREPERAAPPLPMYVEEKAEALAHE